MANLTEALVQMTETLAGIVREYVREQTSPERMQEVVDEFYGLLDDLKAELDATKDGTNFVIKSGDSMTGALKVVVPGSLMGARVSSTSNAALFSKLNSNGAATNWLSVQDAGVLTSTTPPVVGFEDQNYLATTKTVADYWSSRVIVSATEPTPVAGTFWAKTTS